MYKILLDEEILTKNEIQLIQFIHQNISVTLGDHSCQTSKGVPQGSTISPLLFDIYLNSLIRRLKDTDDNSRKIYAFADDILITSQDLDSITDCIKTTEKWCLQFDMTLNKKKSAILIMKDRHKLRRDLKQIRNIPIVRMYKYLGITINEEWNFNDHFDKLKKKINFIKYKLHFVSKKSSIRFRRNCFKVFICPLFRHTYGLLYYAKATDKERLCRLWRTSFKSFIGLKQNTPKSILDIFLPYDFLEDMKSTFQDVKHKVRNRYNERLSQEIERKQKIMRNRPNNNYEKVISRYSSSFIVRINNMTGKKIRNRRIKKRDFIRFFGCSFENLTRVALNPTISPILLQKLQILENKLKNEGFAGFAKLLFETQSPEHSDEALSIINDRISIDSASAHKNALALQRIRSASYRGPTN